MLSKLYKEILKLSIKKTTHPTEKCIKELNRHLTKDDIKMTTKHMKKCFTSHVIKEMHAKTARYLYMLFGMSKIRNTDNTKFKQECGARETLIDCWWECKMVHLLWKTYSYYRIQQPCSLNLSKGF